MDVLAREHAAHCRFAAIGVTFPLVSLSDLPSTDSGSPSTELHDNDVNTAFDDNAPVGGSRVLVGVLAMPLVSGTVGTWWDTRDERDEHADFVQLARDTAGWIDHMHRNQLWHIDMHGDNIGWQPNSELGGSPTPSHCPR
jgi:hypothetical protein